MPRKFLINLSQTDMMWRFSQEDKRQINDKPIDFGGHTLQEVEAVLCQIPPREADMVRLYYIQNLEQKAIGRVFQVSQGDVFYRLNRAIKRIKFILDLPKITQEQMEADLRPIMEDDLYLHIMWGLYTTTSQTEVATRCGLTQGKIRYRYLKALKRVRECADVDTKYEVYVKAFTMIQQSFNITRELRTQDRWKHKFEGEKR